VQFGYTGLLNFGQIAFAMLGGYGIAISVSQWGLPFWVGVLVGILAAVVLALLPRPADAAAARGLPRHRDHRGGRGPATALPLGCRPRPVTNGTRGLSGFNADFVALAPWDTARQYPILGTRWSGAELWGHGRRLDAGGAGLPADLGLLVRSPWGPGGSKSIREGRGRRPRTGEERHVYRCRRWSSAVSWAPSAG
jgi:branched-chain amino acid transport system permease protein